MEVGKRGSDKAGDSSGRGSIGWRLVDSLTWTVPGKVVCWHLTSRLGDVPFVSSSFGRPCPMARLLITVS